MKAWLITKGYVQAYNIKYEETLGPVAKMGNSLTIVELAATKRLHLH